MDGNVTFSHSVLIARIGAHRTPASICAGFALAKMSAGGGPLRTQTADKAELLRWCSEKRENDCAPFVRRMNCIMNVYADWGVFT